MFPTTPATQGPAREKTHKLVWESAMAYSCVLNFWQICRSPLNDAQLHPKRFMQYKTAMLESRTETAQRAHIIKNGIFVSPNASLALHYGGFVPRQVLAGKGLLLRKLPLWSPTLSFSWWSGLWRTLKSFFTASTKCNAIRDISPACSWPFLIGNPDTTM